MLWAWRVMGEKSAVLDMPIIYYSYFIIISEDVKKLNVIIGNTTCQILQPNFLPIKFRKIIFICFSAN